MKRKTLTTAVLAGLTGMAGMVSVSNAVNVNPDGLGQALLYPYYSVRGGNDTLISIVNTTDNAKSVKIRFLEGLNSREVLDFNIYMSAFDVWVAAVTADGDGAKLLIPDETCTVPYFFGDFGGEIDFRDFEYTGDADDGGPQGLERLQSGYFEVLEMGTLVDAEGGEGSATAATHVDGTPADCQQLVDAWTVFPNPNVPNGYWLGDAEIDHEPPSGGLFGGATIINPAAGTLLSYNATALDNWNSAISHTTPGSVQPRLNDGNTESLVFFQGVALEDEWMTGQEAVNATIMFDQLMNEYVINGIADARSEWVLTFPTKRFHVDAPSFGMTAAIPPFTQLWAGTAGNARACEPVTFRLWDREERELGQDPDFGDPIPPQPSPPGPVPPPPEPDLFELCWEANVIRFASEANAAATATEIMGEVRFTTLVLPDDGFDSGWARFNLGVTVDPNTGLPTEAVKASRPSANGIEYVGLPVIGFWANTFTNSALVFDGQTVLSNYGGTFQHRGSRRVQLANGD